MSKSHEEILRLLLEVSGQDEARDLGGALGDLGEAGSKTERELRGLLDEVLEVEDTQRAIESFRQLGRETLDLSRAFHVAQSEAEGHGEALRKAYATRQAAAERAAAAEGKAAREAARELKAAERAVKAAERTYAKAQAEVSRLSTALEGKTAKVRESSAALKQAGVDTTRLGAAERELAERARAAGDSVRRLAGEQAALNQRLRDGDAAQRRASEANRASAAALRDYRERARAAQQQTKGLADQASRSADVMGRLRGVFVGLLGVLSLRSAAEGVKNLLGLGDAAEKTRIRLAALYGSQDAGNVAFDSLRQLARDNGQEFEQLLEVAARLKTFGIEPLNGTLQGLIDKNAEMGGSQETLQGIVLALGQAWAKQKLQGEEILQLVERGVPVWDLLAKATGKNVGELQRLSAEGKLGRDVIRQLMDEIARSAEGASARNLGLLSTILQGLRDRVQEFQRAIADSGALDYFRGRLQQLTQQIDAMAANGSLLRWARAFSDAIVGTARAVEGAVAAAVRYSGELALLAKAYVAVKFASFLAGVGASAARMLEAATAARTMGAAMIANAGPVGRLGGLLAALPKLVRINIAVTALTVIVDRVQHILSLFGKLREEQLAQLEANTRLIDAVATLERRIESIKDVYAQYADAAILGTEQLQAATDAQAQAYQTALEGAIRYYRALALEARRASDEAGFAEATRKLGEYEAALRAARPLVEEIVEATGRAIDRFGDVSEAAVAKFDDLVTKGSEAAQAVKGMFAEVKFTDPEGLRVVAEILEQVEARGTAAGRAVREELRAQVLKLSNEDFAAFERAQARAFDEGAKGAKEFEDALAGISLARLGVDLEQIRTGFSDTGRAAVQAFQGAVAEIAALGLSAEQRSAAIAQAFDAAFRQVSSSEELQAMKAALTTAFTSGNIAADEYQRRLQEIEEVLRRLSGIKPDLEGGADELDRLRRKAGEAGDELERLGTNAEAGSQQAVSAVGGIISILLQLNERFAAVSENARQFFVEAYNSAVRTAGSIGDVVEAAFRAAEATDRAIQSQQAQARGITDLYAEFAAQGERATAAAQNLGRAGEQSLRQIADAAREGNSSLNLLNQADLDQLAAAADAAADRVARIAEEAKAAAEELDQLTRQLQDDADRRAGRESEVIRRQYEEELARINELAERSGLEGRARAAEARQLLEQQYQAQLEALESQREAERGAHQQRLAEAEAEAEARAGATKGRQPSAAAGGLGSGSQTLTLLVRNQQDGRSVLERLDPEDIDRIAMAVMQSIGRYQGASL